MFLPVNTTSILQPMGQGILEGYIFYAIMNESSSLLIPDIVKLTIKDAVYWSAQTWEEAT